ncbi:MAG: reverse transcriptase/maturase family protein [Planctomycetota bacterium]
MIHDPKRRTITAVPFRDRVVHHALLAPLQPIFERRMIDDSHACRPGKGTSSAMRRAEKFVRRHHYALKLDVRAFFDSLRHADVLSTLGRLVKDRRVLGLCETILGTGGRGLPIGSLTSQWFANMALDPLDHFVKEELRIPGYLRYMDDFALFADDKRTLSDAHAEVAGWLATHLDLSLKRRATRLAPTTEGLHFLGFTIRPGSVRLRPDNLRRFRWRLRWLRRELAHGRIGEDRYVRAVAAVFEHIRPADTLALRRRLSTDLEGSTEIL